MKKIKEKRALGAGFWVLLALVFLVFFALLELGKNTLLGWGIGVLVLALCIVARVKWFKEKRFLARLGGWLCLAALLVGVFYLSAPPYRNVPAVDNENPEPTGVITVEQGALTGVYNADKSVEVYAGIPYAKPPVGDLRWREPQAPESWDGVRVCDCFQPMSMQQRNSEVYNTLAGIIGYHNFKISLKDNYREPVSEDSLYLNVWKPAGDISDAPVLVFIHGGYLSTGQASFSEYRGEDLAKRGIIVVNFAYRLNVFGYMASEELAQESPNGTTGNYGLLDQIQALKWVQQNISAFGGDPAKVTVAGESAGASSVNALCVSPLAKGLFRYAIGESSGIAARQPYHTFRSLADALRTGNDIKKEMGAESIDDLRKTDAEILVSTRYANTAMTVDGYAITEQPYLTYEKQQNNEQALLNGYNSHEANVFNLFTKVDKDGYTAFLKELFPDYAAEAEALVPYDSQPLDYDFAVEAGGEAKGAYNYVLGGAWFAYSHKVWSDYVADENRDVYLYCFNKDNGSLRANHGGEMPYAYGNLWRHADKYTEEDFALSDTMQQYWVNFVRTGNPNGEGLPEWKHYNDSRDEALLLDTETSMQPDMYAKLYPLIDKQQQK